MHINHATQAELHAAQEALTSRYQQLAQQGLALDITRGKPGAEQLALSAGLDEVLDGDFCSANGTDVRNYGGIDGLPEAKALFSQVLGCPTEQLLIGGNSSLTLMYLTIDFALRQGFNGPQSAWRNEESIKFLCPVPGYDRHFAICEYLGIEMITVPLNDDGPDMDEVERLVASDSSIKGLWCVPRFSNPTGCVYSDQTVERIARLGAIAGDNFLVLWDNAYAVHALDTAAPPLADISALCEAAGTLHNVVQFGSTSKVTFAGAGVAFMASSPRNLAALKTHLGFQTIGPDKVNQLRHVRFLQSPEVLAEHMARHAALIGPRFDVVLQTLERELADTGMGQWSTPTGGYFISFETLPGLAAKVVSLADAIGVKLTPAGATYPYGKDPQDSNLRLAPTFSSLPELSAAMDAFTLCVKLASVEAELARRG